MVEITLLFDVSFIILAATLFGYVLHLLKQPLIPSYILAGILIGPYGIGLIKNMDIIATLAELGIALLLFIVGLELTFKRLKNVSWNSALIGTIQVSILIVIGVLVGLAFGFNNIEAIYIGLILAFSSTMIVIKLLTDRDELDTLHGRLILGILLTQDVLVIIALSLLINLDTISLQTTLATVVKGIGLIALALLSRKVAPRLLRNVANSPELLFIFSLTWCLVFAVIAYLSGFSIAIGAFIGGLGLAIFPYNIEIASRMRSLKDFFVTIFFVFLGTALTSVASRSAIVLIVVFILITVILKPFILMILTSYFKYGHRTSFLSSVGLGQASEFSLILVTMGLALGHISQELFSITTIITIITMSITVYTIKYDQRIYSTFAPLVNLLKKEWYHEKEYLSNIEEIEHKEHVVIFGAQRGSVKLIKMLRESKTPFLVVDYDPDVVTHLIDKKIPAIYGDASDVEILEKINISRSSLVISTVPDFEDNIVVLNAVKKGNRGTMVFVTALSVEHALEFYKRGADYVIIPKILSSATVTNFMKGPRLKQKVEKLKKEHIIKLNELIEDGLIETNTHEFLAHLTRLRQRKGSKK